MSFILKDFEVVNEPIIKYLSGCQLLLLHKD